MFVVWGPPGLLGFGLPVLKLKKKPGKKLGGEVATEITPQLDVRTVLRAFHQRASAVYHICDVDVKLLLVQTRNNSSPDKISFRFISVKITLHGQ